MELSCKKKLGDIADIVPHRCSTEFPESSILNIAPNSGCFSWDFVIFLEQLLLKILMRLFLTFAQVPDAVFLFLMLNMFLVVMMIMTINCFCGIVG